MGGGGGGGESNLNFNPRFTISVSPKFKQSEDSRSGSHL
jgi:hypothetical protein